MFGGRDRLAEQRLQVTRCRVGRWTSNVSEVPNLVVGDERHSRVDPAVRPLITTAVRSLGRRLDGRDVVARVNQPSGWVAWPSW